MLRKLNDEPSPTSPAIAIKHNYPGDSMTASAQLFVTPSCSCEA